MAKQYKIYTNRLLNSSYFAVEHFCLLNARWLTPNWHLIKHKPLQLQRGV